MLEEPPAPGRWMLTNMGFALEAVDESSADGALSELEMTGRSREDVDRAERDDTTDRPEVRGA